MATLEIINGKKYMDFGYAVAKEKSNGVYKVLKSKNGREITSANTWKRATKLAQLLSEAYVEGYSEGSY